MTVQCNLPRAEAGAVPMLTETNGHTDLWWRQCLGSLVPVAGREVGPRRPQSEPVHATPGKLQNIFVQLVRDMCVCVCVCVLHVGVRASTTASESEGKRPQQPFVYHACGVPGCGFS